MTKAKKKKLNAKSIIGKVLVYAGLILFALWVLLPFSAGSCLRRRI